MKTIIRDILITLAIALSIFFALKSTLQAYQVFECCMEPNYVEGEWIMVSKASYWCGEPERGDVIILDPPFETEEVYIKRLIGLPNDTIEVRDGLVYINGVALDEPYVKEAPAYTLPLRALGSDEYFVLGDNRNNANDSSKGWTISRDDIIGKAWFSYWPTSELGWAENYDLEEQLEAAAEHSP